MEQATTFDPAWIFPDLPTNTRWARNAQFDEVFVRLGMSRVKPNQFVVETGGIGTVDQIHHELGVDYSYGGFGENRRNMLRGTYLEKLGTWTHLGVDSWVPEGTKVYFGRRAQVLRVDNDHDQDGGWGTRIFLRIIGVDMVILFGHLSAEVKVSVEEALVPTKVMPLRPLAYVGGRNENGGWSPHLHVQVMDLSRYKQFLRNPKGLDGYGRPIDVLTFPNPLPFLRPQASE